MAKGTGRKCSSMEETSSHGQKGPRPIRTSMGKDNVPKNAKETHVTDLTKIHTTTQKCCVDYKSECDWKPAQHQKTYIYIWTKGLRRTVENEITKSQHIQKVFPQTDKNKQMKGSSNHTRSI